jgi:hypothetical protein
MMVAPVLVAKSSDKFCVGVKGESNHNILYSAKILLKIALKLCLMGKPSLELRALLRVTAFFASLNNFALFKDNDRAP